MLPQGPGALLLHPAREEAASPSFMWLPASLEIQGASPRGCSLHPHRHPMAEPSCLSHAPFLPFLPADPGRSGTAIPPLHTVLTHISSLRLQFCFSASAIFRAPWAPMAFFCRLQKRGRHP